MWTLSLTATDVAFVEQQNLAPGSCIKLVTVDTGLGYDMDVHLEENSVFSFMLC